MISYKLLLAFVMIHWLADFALQTNDQAVNKSKSLWMLFKHVTTYSTVWFAFSYILLGWQAALAFTAITFFMHFITDALTSQFAGECFKEKDYHNGFVVVGFDQILHYVQLLVTYELVK